MLYSAHTRVLPPVVESSTSAVRSMPAPRAITLGAGVTLDVKGPVVSEGVTVMVTLVVELAAVPSLTTSRKVRRACGAGTDGATNVGCTGSVKSRITAGPVICVHE